MSAVATRWVVGHHLIADLPALSPAAVATCLGGAGIGIVVSGVGLPLSVVLAVFSIRAAWRLERLRALLSQLAASALHWQLRLCTATVCKPLRRLVWCPTYYLATRRKRSNSVQSVDVRRLACRLVRIRLSRQPGLPFLLFHWLERASGVAVSSSHQFSHRRGHRNTSAMLRVPAIASARKGCRQEVEQYLPDDKSHP